MASINKVILVGNLGRDPETRYMPDGGAVTTAGDLVAFLDAFRAGSLVGPTWRDEMLRPRGHDPEDATEYGLAWQLDEVGSRTRIGHGGGDPGVGAYAGSYPVLDLRMALITNAPPGVSAALRSLEAVLLPDDG